MSSTSPICSLKVFDAGSATFRFFDAGLNGLKVTGSATLSLEPSAIDRSWGASRAETLVLDSFLSAGCEDFLKKENSVDFWFVVVFARLRGFLSCGVSMDLGVVCRPLLGLLKCIADMDTDVVVEWQKRGKGVAGLVAALRNIEIGTC